MLWKSFSWGCWQSSGCFSTASCLRVSVTVLCYFSRISAGGHRSGGAGSCDLLPGTLPGQRVLVEAELCQDEEFLFLGQPDVLWLGQAHAASAAGEEGGMRMGMGMTMGQGTHTDPRAGARRAEAAALLGAQLDRLPRRC